MSYIGFGPFLRGVWVGFREREGSIFSNHQHFAVSTGICGVAYALSPGGVRQDHVWCIFAESAIIFPIDFVWKLEPAISISLYAVWRILVLN